MLGFERVKSAGFSAQPNQAIRAVPAHSTSSEPNTGFPANVGVSSCAACTRTGASWRHASRPATRPRRRASGRCCPPAGAGARRHGAAVTVAPPASPPGGTEWCVAPTRAEVNACSAAWLWSASARRIFNQCVRSVAVDHQGPQTTPVCNRASSAAAFVGRPPRAPRHSSERRS